MRGHFNVQLKDAGGLKDADFEAAIRAGTIDDILKELETKQRAAAWNQIMHYVPAAYFHNVFAHGIGNSPWPSYDQNCWANNISLMVTDSEPVYNYGYVWYGGFHAHFDNIGTSTGSKGMGNGTIGRRNEKLDDGREGVFLMSRFLFLPSQGNSNNIRSLGLFGSQYSNQGTGNEDRYITARVRLKDPDTGLPVVIVKNLNQVLVIEYTIYWIAI